MKKTIFLLLFLCFSQEAAAATTTAPTQVQTQIKVRDAFKDTPVMIEIARCESDFRQFTDAGNVLRGGSGGGMVGVFQFFESIHSAPAKALGFDIKTLEGNIGYAKHLHKTQGTTPWNSAKACWDVPITKPAVPPTRAELEEKIKSLKAQIALLQKQLAKQGKTKER